MALRIKVLTDNFTHEQYFKDTKTGLQFRRMSGSIVWPHGEIPGCVTVLGESRASQNFLGQRRHDVHLCEEYRSLDLSMLIDKTQNLTRSWHVLRWATPLCDYRFYLLDDANDELRKLRSPLIRYSDPLGWSGRGEDLIPFYMSLVRRRTQSEKTLFLGSPCWAADEMRQIDEATSERPTAYPAAAALWFALAEFDLNPMSERLNDRIGSVKDFADPVGGY